MEDAKDLVDNYKKTTKNQFYNISISPYYTYPHKPIL